MKRFDNELNAGSMADIAFLLLIFFLVATTIDVDKGITVKLPPWTEDEVERYDIPRRNVLSVKVNSNNELLVRSDLTPISQLKERTVEFILNPDQRPDLSHSPKKALISLRNDRETSYETYISVYNELKAAYNSIWEEEALKRYGKTYKNLIIAEKKEIRKDFPLVISEAEPTDFALK